MLYSISVTSHIFVCYYIRKIWLLCFVSGSLNESVSCSALYFLRPLMLLWAAPYIDNLGMIYWFNYFRGVQKMNYNAQNFWLNTQSVKNVFRYSGCIWHCNCNYYIFFCVTGNIKTWILEYSYVAEYVIFSVVVYSGKQIQMSINHYYYEHIKVLKNCAKKNVSICQYLNFNIRNILMLSKMSRRHKS